MCFFGCVLIYFCMLSQNGKNKESGTGTSSFGLYIQV